jgi:hypothetical protein
MMPRASKSLNRIRKVALNFHGSLVIKGIHDASDKTDYEKQMSRLVELKQHMVNQRWLGEDMISVSLSRGTVPREGRRYEFTFLK